MAIDFETKYLWNGFPYEGKDESSGGEVSLPTDVVRKRMILLFKIGHKATSDNYFISLDLCPAPSETRLQSVGTIRAIRREISNNLKKTCSLLDTTIVKYANQCKRSKLEMARAANSPVFGPSAEWFWNSPLTIFSAVTSFRAAAVCSPKIFVFREVSKSTNELFCWCSFHFAILPTFRFTCFHANQWNMLWINQSNRHFQL